MTTEPEKQADNRISGEKLEKLYAKYRKRMYGIAMSVLHNSHDAEDALHSAFLSVAKNIEKLGDPDSDKTAAYLFRATKNTALNVCAKRNALANHEVSVGSHSDVRDIADGLAGATEKPQSGSLLNCMETLPDKYRAALQLHFIEEYTISQTAEILGENASTVKQRLVRGKKLLASRLEKKTR